MKISLFKKAIFLATVMVIACAISAIANGITTSDGIYAVSVNNSNIYVINPDDATPITPTVAGSNNPTVSAGNAVDSRYHYAEKYGNVTGIERFDLVGSEPLKFFTRDYTLDSSNNNMTSNINGTLYEIDKNTGNLYILSFDEDSSIVSRNLEVNLVVSFNQFGDIAWGPDGLLYIATNNSVSGNYIWDPDENTLNSLGNTGEYNGIAWYKGRLYGSLSYEDPNSSSGWTGELYELNPSDMSKIGNYIIQEDYRFNDLAAWPHEVPTITVDVNIHPFSDPNPLNLGSGGTTPVAILGSETFDVNNIDLATLRLGNATVKVVGKSDRSLCSIEDIGSFNPDEFDKLGYPDGFDDLVCHFYTTDIVPMADGETLTVNIMGNLYDGSEFEGIDAVKVVKW